MSRISPFHIKANEYVSDENICPRYIKWTKKVMAFDFSKQKKVAIERSNHSFSFRHKYNRTPKKSKNILSRIRRGGQNLRVRCKTSADLWRRWIRGGIMYSTELAEKDETDAETQESEPKVSVIIESDQRPWRPIVQILDEADNYLKPTDANRNNTNVSQSKILAERPPEVTISVVDSSDDKSSKEESKEKFEIKTTEEKPEVKATEEKSKEISVEESSEDKPKEELSENKFSEEKSEEKTEEKSEEKSSEDKCEEKTSNEKFNENTSENKLIENSSEEKTVTEIKVQEVDTNSTINTNMSKNLNSVMPEVVAN